MQLGVHVDFRVPDDIPRLTGAAREAGFTAVQISPSGLEINDRTILAIRKACESASLEILAIASYANPLRPEDATTGFTIGKEMGIARALRQFGVHRLVTRSGTHGATLHDPDPRNDEPGAWKTVLDHVRNLEKLCAAVGAQLEVEPHYAQVLHTVEACEKFCTEIANERVRLVLDPPNLVSPALFEKRGAVIDEVLKKLSRLSGLVHFKDFRARPDGSIEYVAAGEGVVDYRRFSTGILRAGYAGPGIVECVGPETMTAVRQFLLPFIETI